MQINHNIFIGIIIIILLIIIIIRYNGGGVRTRVVEVHWTVPLTWVAVAHR